MKYRYVQSSAVYPAARLILPLLGLCTENEQTHPSLSHPQSSVWHQQISSKIFFRVTKHRLCTKTHFQFVVKTVCCTQFSFKIVICTYTRHRYASKLEAICCCCLKSDQIWDLRFCPAHFTLSAPTSKYQTHQDFTQSETNIFNSSQF